MALNLAREQVQQLEGLVHRFQCELDSATKEKTKVEQVRDATIQAALTTQSQAHKEAMRACEAKVKEGMDRKIRELADIHEQAMCEQVAQDKEELDMKIRDLQESHEKQLVILFVIVNLILKILTLYF